MKNTNNFWHLKKFSESESQNHIKIGVDHTSRVAHRSNDVYITWTTKENWTYRHPLSIDPHLRSSSAMPLFSAYLVLAREHLKEDQQRPSLFCPIYWLGI